MPSAVSYDIVLEIAKDITNNGFEPIFWKRKGTYDQSEFDECGSVVFLLPNNRFSANMDELPKGLTKELSRAYAMNKNIFLAYKRSFGNSYQIYDTTCDDDYIGGQSGTSNFYINYLKSELKNYVMNNNNLTVPVNTNTLIVNKNNISTDNIKYVPDERLLLM